MVLKLHLQPIKLTNDYKVLDIIVTENLMIWKVNWI